jgi:hypothetical protein
MPISAKTKIRIQINLEVLFLLAVTAAALQDLPMSIWAMSQGYPPQPQKYIGFLTVTQFYWLKFFKYFLFSGALGLSFFILLKTQYQQSIRVWKYIAYLTFALLPCIAISIQAEQALSLLSGMKAWLPLGGLLCGIYLTKKFWGQLGKLIDALILLNITISIAQQLHIYFTCQTSNEMECLGYLNGVFNGYRSTGVFVEPSALGAFGVIRLLLLSLEPDARYLSCALSCFTILLSGSRTPMVAAIIPLALIFYQKSYIVINEFKKSKRKFCNNIISYVSIIFIAVLIYSIYSRGFESAQHRVSFFVKSLAIENNLFGMGFGQGTIGLLMLSHIGISHNLLDAPADAQITSLMYQGGLWLVTSLSIIGIWVFIFYFKSVFTNVLTMLVLSLGMVIFEVWPFNIIWFAFLIHSIKSDAINVRNEIQREEMHDGI